MNETVPAEARRKYAVIANWKCNGTTDFVRDIVTNLINDLEYDTSKLDFLVLPGMLHGAIARHLPRAASAFEYYVEMISDALRAERSFDTIPNFTAADVVRLLRVGRNEFIHALNACRSKGWLWKRRKGLVAKQLPPAPPADMPVLHWWIVHATPAAAAALVAGRRRSQVYCCARKLLPTAE